MKKTFLITALAGLLFSAASLHAQDDKSNRPSPPAKVSETLNSGAVVSIDYSQPALKGRTIGKDVEPMNGKVWRAGANEATVFETSKNIMVEGKALPAGKYGFFVLANNGEWTLIFNKVANQWGAFKYNEAKDALRVKVMPGKTASPVERLTYTISKSGKVSLAWGDVQANFHVK
ncbi:MAG: DUF2911 domain-containing protein [Sediminibacterium sp.]